MENCPFYNNCSHIDCEAEFCLKKYKLSRLYDEALIGPKFRARQTLQVDADKSDLVAFQRLSEIEKNIMEFVETGSNLILYSTTSGNGKSSWALRLVQAYFNKIWIKSDTNCHALFIDVSTFLSESKRNFNEKSEYLEHILDNIATADIVIFDDIGHKIATDYEIDVLLRAINTRISQNKATIYTANSLPEEIYENLGSRIASRILNASIKMHFKGTDKRNAKKKMMEDVE